MLNICQDLISKTILFTTDELVMHMLQTMHLTVSNEKDILNNKNYNIRNTFNRVVEIILAGTDKTSVDIIENSTEDYIAIIHYKPSELAKCMSLLIGKLKEIEERG